MQALTASAMAPVLRDVSIRGVRVRFLEAGHGPAIVLVHGFLASHTAWGSVFAPLTSRFRVIAPDLPGFGDSEKPPPSRYAYTATSFAETVVDLISALDVNRAAIIGQRMGATVALTMAVTYPHLVERLVLVSPDLYPRAQSRWERLATAPVVGSVVFKQVAGPRLFLRYFDPWSTPTLPVSARVLDWIDAFSAPAAREAAHATMRSLVDTRPLTARLSRADLPALVCGGGRDDATRLAHVRRLARALPRARLELFDTRAAPEEDRPDDFARRVETFLLEAQMPPARTRTQTDTTEA
jgi:pimeloyl-ACP methyl ester carboxylesterase